MQYYINEDALIANEIPTKRIHTQPHKEVKEWAKSLFETFLIPEQLKPLITRGEIFLTQILSKSSSYFHKNITKHYKLTLIFLANYHKLLHIYSLKYQTPITNDMALHFILLLGYSRLKNNKIDEAKNIFKNVWEYVHISSCDRLMLGIALSNLTFLHLNNGKVFKALEASLKCIQLMGEHLVVLKKENLRHQIVQDSVILINTLILCRKALIKILSTTKKSFYAELYQYINEIGYKCSRKYLGEESDLTKVFTYYSANARLPVYFEVSQENCDERTSLEQKILQQLEGIYEVLKTKRQPQIIYVNQPQFVEPPPVPEPVVEEPPIQQPPESQSESEIRIQPLKIPDEEQIQVGTSVSCAVNGWSIQAHILRPKSLAQKMATQAFGEFFLGTLVLQYSKKRKQFQQLISVERLQKILALLDFENSVVYDLVLKRVNDQEFFNTFFFPHIDIDEDGHLEFMVQKKPIISTFQVQFLSTKSLIFVNHVLGNTFRMKISPFDTSLSLHVNIELRPLTLAKHFEIMQQLPQLIHSVYQKIKEVQYQRQIQISDLIKYETTSVTVKDQDLLQKMINLFLKDLQAFLTEIEQEKDEVLNFMDFLNNYEDELDDSILISFVQAKQTSKAGSNKNGLKSAEFEKIKGRFSFCKYLSNIQSIELFSENNFPTFNTDSQSHAKGTTMIYGDKFQIQFGVPLKFFERQHLMKSILQILTKRYELKMFFSPLRTHDEQLYNQNAIYELPLFCKSYKRTVVEDQNGFMVPVTISHLTVNNQIPLVFRVDVYFPSEEADQYTILIKVQASLWEKPPIQLSQKIRASQQKVKQTEEENDKSNADIPAIEYGFKKDYFLIEWCQMQGYEQMMKKLAIRDMKIFLKGSQLRFYSLQRIFQDFK